MSSWLWQALGLWWLRLASGCLWKALSLAYFFLKVLIEFVTTSPLLFYVLVFWSVGACGILAPRPGVELAPPALESEVLTTEPPEKFPVTFLFTASFPDIFTTELVPLPRISLPSSLVCQKHVLVLSHSVLSSSLQPHGP